MRRDDAEVDQQGLQQIIRGGRCGRRHGHERAAIELIDEGRPDAEFHALSAHLAAADAATKSTAATIQILGAMGFTSEHDAHLFMKRAHVWSQMLGGSSEQLARLLELDEPR